MEIFACLEESRLKSILGKIKDIRIGLIGDICLDIYWEADMTRSELSRETPHFPLPVVKERMSPGAGGNVAANLSALEPASVEVVGLVGEDWRGTELLRCLREAGIKTDKIVRSRKWVTTAYAKPLRKGISEVVYEDPRLDFGNYDPLCEEDEEQVISMLKKVAQGLDILCVSDQLAFGCITNAVRDAVLNLAREGLKVVVDSRDRIELFKCDGIDLRSRLILKPNELEARRAVNKISSKGIKKLDGQAAVKADGQYAGRINEQAAVDSAGQAAGRFVGYAGNGFASQTVSEAAGHVAGNVVEMAETAKRLALETGATVCMTAGPEGCIYTDGMRTVHIPSHKVAGPIDICGAGDTFLSAFSCVLAAGAEMAEAAALANLASEVTIAKVGTTGTATPEEISVRYREIAIYGDN